jgi:RNA polymerase sigma factor (sigma-70 family)
MFFPPRQDITEMFSTFIKLKEDKFSKWVINSGLRKNMQNCYNTFPEILQENLSEQEKYWAIYWYQNWRSSQSDSRNIAKMHLQAYLQEPCYMTAINNAAKTFLSKNLYSVADFFQIANAEIEKVLKNFDTTKSSGLKEYFLMAIRSRIRDILRQRNEADLCSDWGLLRKISKKVLEKALENAGFKTTEIAQYCLAWKCFNELYLAKQPTKTRQLPQPSPQLWQAIANLYNDSVSMLGDDIPPCTVEKIKLWLKRIAANVRSYKFPVVESLDTFSSEDDGNQTLTNILPSDENSPIIDMIAAEDFQIRQNQIYRIHEVLSAALQALDTQSKTILRLYYYEKLTQQQIVQQLEVSQSMVSRKLSKGRKSLLEALFEWSQSLNIFVNPNQMKDMSDALEEWLQNHLGVAHINP